MEASLIGGAAVTRDLSRDIFITGHLGHGTFFCPVKMSRDHKKAFLDN